MQFLGYCCDVARVEAVQGEQGEALQLGISECALEARVVSLEIIYFGTKCMEFALFNCIRFK